MRVQLQLLGRSKRHLEGLRWPPDVCSPSTCSERIARVIAIIVIAIVIIAANIT